jgi:transcriptional regulator NrdR family protein
MPFTEHTVNFVCPSCNKRNMTKCISTKKLKRSEQVIRYRRCLLCGHKFYTSELILTDYAKRYHQGVSSFQIMKDNITQRFEKGDYYL